MDREKGKFQFAGLKFLYEMELVDDPQLINNLKLNIFDISSSIRDVEFLSSYHHRQMLIYIELSWFGRKFLQKGIEAEILDRVQQLLPNFKFRVTSDRKILDMALDRVKTVLKGGNNESSSVPASGSNPGADQHSAVAASKSGSEPELQEEPGVLQDSKTEAGDR